MVSPKFPCILRPNPTPERTLVTGASIPKRFSPRSRSGRCDRSESRRRIMKTGWELKKKAAHPVAQHGGNLIVILHQGLGSDHPLFVGNGLVHLHAVNKSGRCIAFPAPYGRRLRPAVERRVELHGIEDVGIVTEPVSRRGLSAGVKDAAPVGTEPAGAAHPNPHAPWTGGGNSRAQDFMHRAEVAEVFTLYVGVAAESVG